MTGLSFPVPADVDDRTIVRVGSVRLFRLNRAEREATSWQTAAVVALAALLISAVIP